MSNQGISFFAWAKIGLTLKSHIKPYLRRNLLESENHLE